MFTCFRYKGKETLFSFLYNLIVPFQRGHDHLIHILRPSKIPNLTSFQGFLGSPPPEVLKP